MELTGEYKGFEIKVSEWDEGKAVSASIDHPLFYNSKIDGKSLKSIKQKINKIIKDGFERFDVYVRGWSNNEFYIVTVTSIDEYGDFWVIDKEGNRSKHHNVYEKSDYNDSIIKAIVEKAKEKETLNKEFRAIENKLKEVPKQGGNNEP